MMSPSHKHSMLASLIRGQAHAAMWALAIGSLGACQLVVNPDNSRLAVLDNPAPDDGSVPDDAMTDGSMTMCSSASSSTACDDANGCTNDTCNTTSMMCEHTLVDTDNDNHGPISVGGKSCVGFAGNKPADDCDDMTNTRFPGNAETCDGIDNDCNTNVDDNCVGDTCSKPIDVALTENAMMAGQYLGTIKGNLSYAEADINGICNRNGRHELVFRTVSPINNGCISVTEQTPDANAQQAQLNLRYNRTSTCGMDVGTNDVCPAGNNPIDGELTLTNPSSLALNDSVYLIVAARDTSDNTKSFKVEVKIEPCP